MQGSTSLIIWLSAGLLLQAACLSTQRPSNSFPSAEPHRPVYHFTPPEKWMNDPNGMVFFNGEYHLFYQHYPKSTTWGPMHWGHAVSRDLVSWEHLPIALYPDSLGLIFSGSAVIDRNNTSGFGENGKQPMVAIFTQHDMTGEKAGRTDFQYQSIAYSNDGGRQWTKYANNPVIPNTEKIKDFRDPKVIWDEDSKQWVMVFAAHDQVKIWGSKNLKDWTHLSDFGKQFGTHGGVWECPDMFPITVEKSGEKRWVLLLSINPGSPNGGSGTQYFVGNFDGKKFSLDPDFQTDVLHEKAVWLDWGRDNYAGVTWSDIPKSDGRRIFIGWMSNWDYATVVPTEKWRSALTLPRELTLQKTVSGYRLFSNPVRELNKRHGNQYAWSNVSEPGINLTEKSGISPTACELELEFTPGNSEEEFVVELTNTKNESYRIGYNVATNRFFSDRTKSGPIGFSAKFASQVHFAPRSSKNKTIKMRLFFDRSSCELFADGGAVCLTDIFFPTEDFSKLTFTATGAKTMSSSGTIFQIK